MDIPVIDTPRLRLRAPDLGDFPAYADYCASERSAGVGGPYTEGRAFQNLAAVIGHWSLRGFGRWTVTDRATAAPLGIVGPHHPIEWPEPEMAWTVFAAAEGRGIAAEAARAARDYVYDILGWDTVISCIPPDNARSIALARRLGATQDPSFFHPQYGELLVWRHPARQDPT